MLTTRLTGLLFVLTMLGAWPCAAQALEEDEHAIGRLRYGGATPEDCSYSIRQWDTQTQEWVLLPGEEEPLLHELPCVNSTMIYPMYYVHTYAIVLDELETDTKYRVRTYYYDPNKQPEPGWVEFEDPIIWTQGQE